MNVLEKILKEIEEKNKIADDCNENLAFIDGVRYGLIEAKKIIRSHMNDGKDTNVPSNWIPCSERLPEEGIYVMCCFDDGLCDRKGILVEDEDTCDKWSEGQADWKERMLSTFWQGIKEGQNE